jgi:hypothetical protein
LPFSETLGGSLNVGGWQRAGTFTGEIFLISPDAALPEVPALSCLSENGESALMTNRTFSNRGTASREQIAQRAYEIWEQTGRPDGQSSAHWFQAEAELAMRVPTPQPPAQPASARSARRVEPASARPRLAASN